MFWLFCLTQEQNTASLDRRNAVAKIRVSARDSANPIALFWSFVIVLVKDCFRSDALVGVLSS